MKESFAVTRAYYSRYKMAVMTSYKLYMHSACHVRVWDLESRKEIGMFLRHLESSFRCSLLWQRDLWNIIVW